MSHKRHIGRRSGVIAATVVATVIVLAGAASAHYYPNSRTVRVYQDPGVCVEAWGEQWHDRHHFMTTAQTGGYCTRWERGPNQIAQTAKWYVNGSYCAYSDWYYNPTRNWAVKTNIIQDVFWLGCNRGSGVHVTITMDTWNYVQSNDGSWRSGAARPITYHCHCP